MKRLFLREDGQGLVEYGLIIALVAVLLVGSLVAFGTRVGDAFGGVSQGLVSSQEEEQWVLVTTEHGVYIETTNALGRMLGRFSGEGLFVRIPVYLDGKMVREIGQEVFGNKGLEDVQLHDGIQRIHARAFQNNALSKIDLPQGLTRIDWGAFRGNRLTEIRLPGSIGTIEGSAFAGNDITRISIGSNVSIGDHAFRNDNAGFRSAYASGGPGTYVFQGGRWIKE